MNCHTAELFGPCHEPDLYKGWKCADLKARLYVEFLDQPTCLKDLYKYHPTFSEYYQLCMNAMLGVCAKIILLMIVLLLNIA